MVFLEIDGDAVIRGGFLYFRRAVFSACKEWTAAGKQYDVAVYQFFGQLTDLWLDFFCDFLHPLRQ